MLRRRCQKIDKYVENINKDLENTNEKNKKNKEYVSQ